MIIKIYASLVAQTEDPKLLHSMSIKKLKMLTWTENIIKTIMKGKEDLCAIASTFMSLIKTIMVFCGVVLHRANVSIKFNYNFSLKATGVNIWSPKLSYIVS